MLTWKSLLSVVTLYIYMHTQYDKTKMNQGTKTTLLYLVIGNSPPTVLTCKTK